MIEYHSLIAGIIFYATALLARYPVWITLPVGLVICLCFSQSSIRRSRNVGRRLLFILLQTSSIALVYLLLFHAI